MQRIHNHNSFCSGFLLLSLYRSQSRAILKLEDFTGASTDQCPVNKTAAKTPIETN